MEIQQFRNYVGTLRTRRGDGWPDVRPEAAALEGAELNVRASWLFADGSRPEYEGEWAMVTDVGVYPAWVASGDLADLRPA